MRTLLPNESDVSLLPPIVPAFLFHRRGGAITVRPRAELDPSSAEQLNSRRDSNGSSSTSGNVNKSGGDVPIRFTLPTGFRGSIGMGVGGGLFLGGVGAAKAVALWPFGGRNARGPTPESEKRRILIGMSNTGGGHKASAEAIKAAFQETYGDKYEITIVDLWKEHTPVPFNAMPDTYSFLVRNAILWRITYQFTNPKLVHVPYLSAVSAFVSRHVSQALDSYNPDLVVSVHPLMQHIPIKVLRDRIKSGASKPINFATVVTDFTTCHNTWFCPGATRCFVPTEYCRDLAISNEMDPRQIIMHGLPIRPAFSRRLPPKPRLRRQLGMAPALPAVLLVGGGEGMGALEETVAQLDSRLGDKCQVVVICGRNQKLQERLRARPAGAGHPLLHVRGFVDNIHEWMGACDAIITKAGPGTIAEALIAGLPILLNGNVPCQEEGNIPYVVDNRVGAFETRPDRIAAIMDSWLLKGGRHWFEDMGKRAKALGRPEAVYRIVDDLAALTEEPYFDFGPATAALLGAEGAKKRKSWRPHKHPHGHPHGNGPMLAPAPA
ncbi:hypothetical protein CHLRE_13g585301v5 [Chlamydomonas reinhardtii]|uniref:monogalactosyldiacylglycerol synthase n=1 Tax=Chlamydomonas reinhardtii TaxID=3055 RepID=H1AFJ8_CHLRE|nr:uncharacterized protein CHLRE_13g585301v5 [Chlamydomonas reinhardtii]PNW74102.1 hypothetical protein CHLRE_13g585301v5 [Chlamydomonas reinhardtii]BAL46508.1 monogalactosyldiacylglycerol synthase [Chlamydomonas reinhardtii]